MRYKFYREHKYVSAACNDLERLVAKTDFRVRADVEKVNQEYCALVHMLKGHAYYEDTVLHELLKKRASPVYAKIEADHHELDAVFAHLEDLLKKAIEATQEEDQEEDQIEEDQIEAGYQFYLAYRKFVGDNLVHLHEEETIILPELHRLYSDEELSVVEFDTYKLMSTEDIVGMITVLFSHMNPTDHEVFLTDIKKAQPEKFAEAWPSIQVLLSEREREALVKKLKI